MFLKENSVEIIKDRLFWYSHNKPPKKLKNSYYFNIDRKIKYEAYYSDFGPINIYQIVKYCNSLKFILKEQRNNIVIHHTSDYSVHRLNSALLIGSYMIIILSKSSEEVINKFSKVQPSFIAYRDASYNENCSYKCTLEDCLRGLEFAIKMELWSLKSFDSRNYKFYSEMHNGDLNWIIKHKIMAFSCPEKENNLRDLNLMKPRDYIPIFKKQKIKLVIRLNKPNYDKHIFIDEGI